MTLEGPKWLAMGSKWAHFTCLGTPNGLGSFLEKHIFDPFWTHFLSQNSPFSWHFGILGGPKWATTSSKRAKNTCFGIPCGPRSFLKKKSFFCTRWTLLTHFSTHLFGLPLAACRSPLGLLRPPPPPDCRPTSKRPFISHPFFGPLLGKGPLQKDLYVRPTGENFAERDEVLFGWMSHTLCSRQKPQTPQSDRPIPDHILGYVAQNAIPSAPNPPAPTHFWWVPPLKIAPTDA